MSIPSMSSITDFPSSAVHGRRLSNMKEARGDRRDVSRGAWRHRRFIRVWHGGGNHGTAQLLLLVVHSVTVVSVYYWLELGGLDVFACAYSDGKNSI